MSGEWTNTETKIKRIAQCGIDEGAVFCSNSVTDVVRN